MADERPHPTIIMTPPVQAGAPHPRRAPANRSVSLLHSPRKRPSPSKDSSDSSSSDSAILKRKKSNSSKADDSPSSLQPLGRDSSGESSNAERWFELSNNEVRDHSASFADNDPPFFMRNSSSSETPPEAQNQMRQLLGGQNDGNSLPLRTNMVRMGTDRSSNDDYRSVIDDLTIENKKLRRRLKKYEKLHDSHLKDEKLFEVRIHGLPPEKKRELEETLRKFASGIGGAFPASGYDGLLPALAKQNTASSQTSYQNADSAYASMSLSASGQGSSAQSGNDSKGKQPGATSASRQQNIHTYLHDIPEGLLPRPNPANMTERSKKKLVVRRLEQIFAGKGAALGGHHHSLQQQDVSQMAARADRAASEARGQKSGGDEGTREAHIMKRETEDPAEPSRKTDDATSPDEPSDTVHSEVSAKAPRDELANPDSQPEGEQRPARPLDLDPDRAQVPAENIRYIRHLGFSPPDLESGRSPEEGHGWIYLNLLINMAQLHTIHVTSEFVRKALQEYSSKFEISADGRKVRWRGGRSVTRTSSSGGQSSNSRAGLDTPDAQSPRKRPRLSQRHTARSGVSSAQLGASSALRNQSESGKWAYTPMFFHRETSDDAEDSSDFEDDMSSPFAPAPGGDSSGMTSSELRTASTKVKKREDGPIIFYNNARFCTDLSGDRRPIAKNAPPYTTATEVPLGMSQNSSFEAYERRGPLEQAAKLPEPMELSDNPIPSSMELNFPPRSPPKVGDKRNAEHLDMEVTGIGGIWPADNFAIDVETRHVRVDQNDEAGHSRVWPTKHLPARIAYILQHNAARKQTGPAIHNSVVSTTKSKLAPSELPPALGFMPYGEDSLGDEESDVDDSVSDTPESPGALLPSAAPQPVQVHFASSEDGDEEESDEDDDEDDDGSLDLLAAARQLDPEAILQQEREYDANMADRLAEEIPAGSSAATAGGGSGYASPADGNGMSRKEHKRAVQESRAEQPSGLKRAKSNDSTKVQRAGESSSEDEDSDEEMEDVKS